MDVKSYISILIFLIVTQVSIAQGFEKIKLGHDHIQYRGVFVDEFEPDIYTIIAATYEDSILMSSSIIEYNASGIPFNEITIPNPSGYVAQAKRILFTSSGYCIVGTALSSYGGDNQVFVMNTDSSFIMTSMFVFGNDTLEDRVFDAILVNDSTIDIVCYHYLFDFSPSCYIVRVNLQGSMIVNTLPDYPLSIKFIQYLPSTGNYLLGGPSNMYLFTRDSLLNKGKVFDQSDYNLPEHPYYHLPTGNSKLLNDSMFYTSGTFLDFAVSIDEKTIAIYLWDTLPLPQLIFMDGRTGYYDDAQGHLFDFITPDNAFITGYSMDVNLKGTQAWEDYYSAVLIYHIDLLSGNKKWERLMYENYNSKPEYCKATSDGGCVFTGHRYDFINKRRDLFIVKLDSNGNYTPDAIIDRAPLSMTIFPNPASNALFVEFALQSSYNIEIIEPTGQLIYQSTINNSSACIDVSDFCKGLYLIHVTSDDGQIINDWFIIN